jgi:hypothetical protein
MPFYKQCYGKKECVAELRNRINKVKIVQIDEKRVCVKAGQLHFTFFLSLSLSHTATIYG